MLLREFVQQDDRELYDLDSDPEVLRFMPNDEPPALEVIQNEILPRRFAEYQRYPGFGFWVAIERDSDAFMGWFHFRPYQGDVRSPEIGYRLKRVFWGKGIATEVSQALVERAFALPDVVRVVAEASPDNVASTRVMEKVGLRLILSDAERDKVVYELKREDWAR